MCAGETHIPENAVDESSPVVQILIAGDQTILLDCLKCLLDTQPDFRIVGEAHDGQAALNLINQLKADILLLDLSAARFSTVEVLRSLAASGSKVQPIMLSAGVEGDQIIEAFQLGARGLVLKEWGSDLLFKAIRCVVDGQCWIGGESVSDPVPRLRRLKGNVGREVPGNNFRLTPREKEVISAAVAGYTNKEIAKQLSIREQTVKHHLTNIFDKIGVFNRLELALFALHHELIEKP